MKTKLSLILSSIAIVISIITICLTMPRREMPIDYLGLITGIFGNSSNSADRMEHLYDYRF